MIQPHQRSFRYGIFLYDETLKRKINDLMINDHPMAHGCVALGVRGCCGNSDRSDANFVRVLEDATHLVFLVSRDLNNDLSSGYFFFSLLICLEGLHSKNIIKSNWVMVSSSGYGEPCI